MATCFQALRDHDVRTVRFQPAGFFDRQADERTSEPISVTRASSSAEGRPEMKTHNRRLELLQHLGRGVAEGRAAAAARQEWQQG